MIAAIEASGISKIFGDPDNAGDAVEAIKRVDMRVADGEFVALLGPSGCGKSTLLDIIGGLEPASSGEVYVAGERLNGPHEKMAAVFQQMSLFPWRTVLDNVTLGPELRAVDAPTRERTAKEMIELVGLSGFERKYPSQLSGGMCQRVAIARALALNPAILLMDEPFAALDEQTRRLMGLELLRIWDRARKTIVFVTHSIEEAIQLSDRILLMSARPSVIREEIPVPLPRPRGIECLSCDVAKDIERRIWAALMEEVGGAVNAH